MVLIWIKKYPDIQEEGTVNLEKEIKLKDQSVFYSIKITADYFIFSSLPPANRRFDPFEHLQKYYKKGLVDIKRVFGEPLNIYSDSTFKTKTNDFYIWKIKRQKGYFSIYYSIGFAGLVLNIDKMYDERTTNEDIRNSIFDEQGCTGRSYYMKPEEFDLYDWRERY